MVPKNLFVPTARPEDVVRSLSAYMSEANRETVVRLLAVEAVRGRKAAENGVSEVDAIYAAYPRRVAPGAAKKAIAKALAKVPFVVLMDAVCEYAKAMHGRDPNFIPYPATWFNQGRWEDERTEWHRRDDGGRGGAKTPRRIGPGERFDPDAELGSL
jgi:hypothetical protein